MQRGERVVMEAVRKESFGFSVFVNYIGPNEN
jgi:hypothetical protein